MEQYKIGLETRAAGKNNSQREDFSGFYKKNREKVKKLQKKLDPLGKIVYKAPVNNNKTTTTKQQRQ